MFVGLCSASKPISSPGSLLDVSAPVLAPSWPMISSTHLFLFPVFWVVWSLSRGRSLRLSCFPSWRCGWHHAGFLRLSLHHTWFSSLHPFWFLDHNLHHNWLLDHSPDLIWFLGLAAVAVSCSGVAASNSLSYYGGVAFSVKDRHGVPASPSFLSAPWGAFFGHSLGGDGGSGVSVTRSGCWNPVYLLHPGIVEVEKCISMLLCIFRCVNGCQVLWVILSIFKFSHSCFVLLVRRHTRIHNEHGLLRTFSRTWFMELFWFFCACMYRQVLLIIVCSLETYFCTVPNPNPCRHP